MGSVTITEQAFGCGTTNFQHICLLIVKLAVIQLKVEDTEGLRLGSHDQATFFGEPRGKNVGSRLSNTCADL